MMSNSIKYWVYGTLPAALLLMGLLPAVRSAWSAPIILVYLQLPIYMLHQVEEHTSDRFLRFVNQTIGHGKEIITLTEIFWINVPGVWGCTKGESNLALFISNGQSPDIVSKG